MPRQLASVAGLAVFVAGSVSRRPQARAASPVRVVATAAGWIAVVAMALSATVVIVLGLGASALGIDTALALRAVSFSAGGVVHVVSLGVFVFTLTRLPGWSRPVRVMAWIGAVPAVLSIASVFVFVLSILLPAGRLLAMVALVTAGVSLARGRSVLDRQDRGTPRCVAPEAREHVLPASSRNLTFEVLPGARQALHGPSLMKRHRVISI